MVNICKMCNNNFDSNTTKISEEGYCSKQCYMKSDVFKSKYRDGYLRKRGVNIEELSNEDKIKIFHQIRGEDIKLTQSKRVDTIYSKYGEKAFIDIGNKGKLQKEKDFIKNIGINIDNLTENEINNLYLENFNKISKHSDKIIKGLYNKYIDSDGILNEFRRRSLVAINNYIINLGLDPKSLNNDEYNNHVNNFNKLHAINISTIEWKKTHLKNLNIDNVDLMSENDINIKYGEYLSNRMKFLPENMRNGWKRTKKGFYIFKNFNTTLFYRSSWELYVFELIDTLKINNDYIIDVKTPKGIPYTYENKIRKYFPDLEILLSNNKTIIYEIKPIARLLDPINIAKFEYANKYYKNYIVITENEIYNLDFLEKNIKEIYEC